MTEETITKKEKEETKETNTNTAPETSKATPATPVAAPALAARAVPSPAPKPFERNERNPRGKRRRVVRREDRARSELGNKVISIRRVTRVVAGGRRFSFSVAIVVGDKKGSVGVGIGKASDTVLAIEKATRSAKKNMMKVPLTKEMMIPHQTSAKYCASEVMIMPARGKGLSAGSSVRNVLELAGVKDVTAKILSRSKNKLNNAKAAMKALEALKV